jgi:hypothetical protein
MHIDVTGTSWEEFSVGWQKHPDEPLLLDSGLLKIALSAFVRNDGANDTMEIVWSCARAYYDDFDQPAGDAPSSVLGVEWLDIVQQEPGGLFSITGIVLCGGVKEHNVNERCESAIEYLMGAIHKRWSADCCEACATRFLKYAPTRTQIMARLQDEEWFV